MKITIDVRMLHSSGIGIYIQNLAPRIMRLRKEDFFYLVGRPSEREDPVWRGLPNYQWIDCRAPIYSLRQQWEFPGKVPKDTDLLWVPHYDIPIFYRGRMMVTVHDLFHLAMPELAGGLHKKLYARWMFGQLARKAGIILTISQFTHDELKRLVGPDDAKVRMVHNGLAPEWFLPSSGENPRSRPYFLYVGNIKPHKNLRRLLEAFALIQNKVPHDLLLVGQKEGFLSGDVEVQALAGEFRGRVEFTGKVSTDELKRYYAHADMLVFPSIYEGFGLPPLEAMACGCPVTASRAASIPEVCGESVLYFNPQEPKDIAEKMERLAQDKTLRSELKQKGLKRAQGFSWDESAKETDACIQELRQKT